MYDMAAVHAIDAHLAARDLQGLFDMERHLRAVRGAAVSASSASPAESGGAVHHSGASTASDARG